MPSKAAATNERGIEASNPNESQNALPDPQKAIDLSEFPPPPTISMPYCSTAGGQNEHGKEDVVEKGKEKDLGQAESSKGKKKDEKERKEDHEECNEHEEQGGKEKQLQWSVQHQQPTGSKLSDEEVRGRNMNSQTTNTLIEGWLNDVLASSTTPVPYLPEQPAIGTSAEREATSRETASVDRGRKYNLRPRK